MDLITLVAAASLGASAVLSDPDPIVVTASRTPVSEALSGTSLSVIDASEIGALKLPLVSDYLRLVPSVAVATSGPLGAFTEVRIRGAENRHTLTFIDGIEANDPASSSVFQFQTLLADGIERIEVLRGPQSALWGAQAIGGVINVVNRAPPVGTEAYGQAEGGSFGTFRAGAGGGWGNDVGGLTAQANYLTSRGYDISATPGGNKNGYSNLSLSVKGFYHPVPNLEVGAVGRYSDANSQFDDFDYTNGVALDARLSTRIRVAAGRAYANLSLFDNHWTHTVEVAATDAANVNRDAGVFLNRSDGSRLKFAYQTSGTASTGSLDHRLTLAVEHERQTFASTDAIYSGQTDQRRDRAKTAVIAEYRVELPERLAAGVSLRHDDSNRYPTENTVRATLAGQFGSGFGGHASYGEGVSDPTFFDLYGFFPTQFVGNPNLKPEHARSVDAGLSWSRNGVKLDVTGYTSDLTDAIVSTFDSKTFLSGVANATGRSKRRGIEATAQAQVASWLRLDASYAYLDASQQSIAGGPAVKPLRRPPHSGSVSAFASLGRYDVNVSVAEVGARQDTNFATFQNVTLHSYALVTLSGAYRITPHIAVTARIENAADSRYQDVYGYRTPGIAAYGGIKVKL